MNTSRSKKSLLILKPKPKDPKIKGGRGDRQKS